MKKHSICVYCGSQPGNDPDIVSAAKTLGHAIADQGMNLVYGGGTNGIMGAVADAVVENGGGVTGIIPEFLLNWEANPDKLFSLGDIIITKDMHERKHLMFEKADAFVTMPGGIGTLEEIVEIMTWAQLGRHTKPMVFGNIKGFWDPMLSLIDHMIEAGFLHDRDKVQPRIIDRAEAIIPYISDQFAKDGQDHSGDERVIAKL